jgi:hypothetical protein
MGQFTSRLSWLAAVEVLKVKVGVKKAIMRIITVSNPHLKRLMWASYSDPGDKNSVRLPTTIQI